MNSSRRHPAPPPAAEAARERAGHAWLLLMHQLPPKPDYQRVKVWRRLQALGAVAVRNAVYALPMSDRALEDMQWVAKEIEAAGGTAVVCAADLVGGLDDGELRGLFNAARDADYAAIAGEADEALARAGRRDTPTPAMRAELETRLRRLRQRLARTQALDFFAAGAREPAEAKLTALAERLHAQAPPAARKAAATAANALTGRVWVTRRGIHVDRMASAWLIRRFIDAEARFKFVGALAYKPARHEVRFDMFDAEFTHEGDRCTFEVLLDRFALAEPALVAIGEIVHDIDLRDDKFARPEAAGIAEVVEGIAARHGPDEERLAAATVLFDALHARLGAPARAADGDVDRS